MNDPTNHNPGGAGVPHKGEKAMDPCDRLAELLADQSLEGLTPEQELELESLLASEGVDNEDCMAMTAAVLELSLLQTGDSHTIPPHVTQRLERSGLKWARASATVLRLPKGHDDPIPVTARKASHLLSFAAPWLAAAACLALAAGAWVFATRSPDLVAMVDAQPVKLAATWSDWNNPAMKSVQGKVVWCDHIQKGYMKFAGLPRNDPKQYQYQVWIVDDRGMDHRISGGVFDVADAGEVMVPINAPIEVHHAKVFAITMEEPGGTWVSDMSRPVVIAQK